MLLFRDAIVEMIELIVFCFANRVLPGSVLAPSRWTSVIHWVFHLCFLQTFQCEYYKIVAVFKYLHVSFL